MPRFYFNVRNDGWISDKIGVVLASHDEAKNEARRLASYFPGDPEDGAAATVVVTDELGEIVLEVTLWRPY